jgi:hypothetical protein
MSFGWSASDIAQTLIIIVKTVKALDDATGAPAHYREAVSFLGNLRHTLEPLQTLTVINRYPAFGDEICHQVRQIKDPIERFLSIVAGFEPSYPGLAPLSRGIKISRPPSLAHPLSSSFPTTLKPPPSHRSVLALYTHSAFLFRILPLPIRLP